MLRRAIPTRALGHAAALVLVVAASSCSRPRWREGGVYSLASGLDDGRYVLIKVVDLDEERGCALVYEHEHVGRPGGSAERGLQQATIAARELVSAHGDQLALWDPVLVAREAVTGAERARCSSATSEKAESTRRGLLEGCVPPRSLPGLVLFEGRAVVPADAVLTLEQEPCGFDHCPVFSVSMAADGSVSWTGTRNVAVVGDARGEADPARVADLFVAACSIGFFELQDDYRPRDCPEFWTDLPRYEVTLRVDGQEKRVAHDHGCRGVPELERLAELERMIGEAAGIDRWVRAP